MDHHPYAMRPRHGRSEYQDNCVTVNVSRCHLKDIRPKLSAAPHIPPMWLFLKPFTAFPSHHTTKLTGFIPLYCPTFTSCYCILREAKFERWIKKTLTSHIFHNWKCCLHLVSPSLSLSSFASLFPPLSFCWMFAWMAYHSIWIPLPYQKQGTSALKNDRHTAGGIKAMQNWNLRWS